MPSGGPKPMLSSWPSKSRVECCIASYPSIRRPWARWCAPRWKNWRRNESAGYGSTPIRNSWCAPPWRNWGGAMKSRWSAIPRSRAEAPSSKPKTVRWTLRSTRSFARSSAGWPTVCRSARDVTRGPEPPAVCGSGSEYRTAAMVRRSGGTGGHAGGFAGAGGGSGGFLRSAVILGPAHSDAGDRISERPRALDASGRDRRDPAQGSSLRPAGGGTGSGGAGSGGTGGGWFRPADRPETENSTAGDVPAISASGQPARPGAHHGTDRHRHSRDRFDDSVRQGAAHGDFWRQRRGQEHAAG